MTYTIEVESHAGTSWVGSIKGPALVTTDPHYALYMTMAEVKTVLERLDDCTITKITIRPA